MKLIDLLVKELPKRGGWPDGALNATQDKDGQVCFSAGAVPEFGYVAWEGGDWLGNEFYTTRASDYATAIITFEQYESALAASKGWIEWGGGERPVDSDTIVEVRFRNQNQNHYQYNNDRAGDFEWEHIGSKCDIIAYRLQNPTKSEQVRADAWRAYAGMTEKDEEADLNECIGQGVDMPEWNGDGLPPVGAKVEFFINPKLVYRNARIPDVGTEMEVVAHKTTTDGNIVAVCYWDESGAGRSHCFVPESLKPLRTEAERAREDAETAMRTCLAGTGAGITPLAAKGIYDAIAAGKIPGVKLEVK